MTHFCKCLRFGRSGVFLALTINAMGQQGTAPNGYYPRNYQGATFSGEVMDGPIDVLTLRYKKKNKEETFSGRFDAPCVVPTKDGKLGSMSPSDVNVGDIVTAYFYGQVIKKDGKSFHQNSIIAITFDVVNGKVVPAEKRKFFQCTRTWATVYKAFDPNGAATVVLGPYEK